MLGASLQQTRRRFTLVFAIAFVLGAAWFFSPGLPVLLGPWASAATRQAGQELFVHEWQPNDPLAHGDGVGPVFNAASCVACHFQGGVGGGGTNQHNVNVFTVAATRRNPVRKQGLVHHFAVDDTSQENDQVLRSLFPIVRGSRSVVVTNNCSYTTVIPDFDPLRTESINTTALFGAGWIDRIADKAIKHNWLKRGIAHSTKELALEFDAVPVGRIRDHSFGTVGKFGWKGQFTSLKDFVAAACANELGLGTPLMKQPKPLTQTEEVDVAPDLDGRQFASLVAFVDTLPRPVEMLPATASERDEALQGKELFRSVGCATCHVPDLGGVKGVYSDFLLYRLETTPSGTGGSYGVPHPDELPPPSDRPDPSEWKTPPLWGVADSAPYFHDGGSPTLEAAIHRHGGDARSVTKAYNQLSKHEQDELIAFLKTLKAPPNALPVRDPR